MGRGWSSTQKFLELSLGEAAFDWRAFLHKVRDPPFALRTSLALTSWDGTRYLGVPFPGHNSCGVFGIVVVPSAHHAAAP